MATNEEATTSRPAPIGGVGPLGLGETISTVIRATKGTYPPAEHDSQEHPMEPTTLNTTTADSTTVALTVWIDPTVEAIGHDPRSRYVETYWLGVLGPTASWVLRRWSDVLDANPDGVEIDLTELAREMGLSYTIGRSSPFAKAIQRLMMFGLAHSTPFGIAVRRSIPDVAHRHVRRMTDVLQARHALDVAAPAPTLDDFTRAHTIALAMRTAGDETSRIERQLVAIGIAAAVAETIAANLAALDR